jgi:hypothetical protein
MRHQMRTVDATQTFAATVVEAERRWYDTSRWPAWVDGLDEVVEVGPGWPAAGAGVIWQSGPAGRGRVTERPVAYEPAAGQTVEVGDDSVQGRQSVVFAAVPGGVQVTLRLEYQLRRRWLLTPLIDLLFIKRAMALSLSRTLSRFGAQLRAR